MSSFETSLRRFEKGMHSALEGDVVVADLRAKHAKMRKNAFVFLRATCWRWAERAAELCPQIIDLPQVAAPGDAHIENFGLWRDNEGRLVWGIQDFDETAVIAYPLDLIRLGASALLADVKGEIGTHAIARALLKGYRSGLENPQPFILEYKNLWLRDLFAASKRVRVKFWRELHDLKKARPPERYAKALLDSLPEKGLPTAFKKRRAGAGGLGRPRFAVLGSWRGGPFAREAKALVPSCWAPDSESDESSRLLLATARGPYRAVDPWFDVCDGVLVRRLGPNSRKLEFGDLGRLRKSVLKAMGFELANIHASEEKSACRIKKDIMARKVSWLADMIGTVAEATREDWKEYKGLR